VPHLSVLITLDSVANSRGRRRFYPTEKKYSQNWTLRVRKAMQVGHRWFGAVHSPYTSCGVQIQIDSKTQTNKKLETSSHQPWYILPPDPILIRLRCQGFACRLYAGQAWKSIPPLRFRDIEPWRRTLQGHHRDTNQKFAHTQAVMARVCKCRTARHSYMFKNESQVHKHVTSLICAWRATRSASSLSLSFRAV